jgi:hypothetical protein
LQLLVGIAGVLGLLARYGSGQLKPTQSLGPASGLFYQGAHCSQALMDLSRSGTDGAETSPGFGTLTLVKFGWNDGADDLPNNDTITGFDAETFEDAGSRHGHNEPFASAHKTVGLDRGLKILLSNHYLLNTNWSWQQRYDDRGNDDNDRDDPAKISGTS